MRFEWEKAQNEIKELRTHTTKDFPHPTEPGKFIKIQSSGLLHAYTDEGFKEIGKEIPSYEFPEGLEITEKKDKHFIMV
ncbi:MAG: hypothetical protein QXQ02_04765, partial [Halobacteria archaeon]